MSRQGTSQLVQVWRSAWTQSRRATDVTGMPGKEGSGARACAVLSFDALTGSRPSSSMRRSNANCREDISLGTSLQNTEKGLCSRWQILLVGAEGLEPPTFAL
jgi:hypothetical protein